MKKSILKKVFLFIICTLILLSIYYIKMHYPSSSMQAALTKSFDTSGAKFVSSEFYAWGRIPNQKTDLEDLKEFAQKFSRDLGLKDLDIFSGRVVNNDHIQRIELEGDIGDNKIARLNIQQDTASDDTKETIITVSVVRDVVNPGLEETAKTVLTTFKRYKIKPKVNACIIGNFEGKLDYDTLNDVCIRAFKEVQAKKVDNMRDGNLISVSAYSPFIGQSIKVNGKDVNLNVAIRYNSYERKTYIWLASPVIATEY